MPESLRAKRNYDQTVEQRKRLCFSSVHVRLCVCARVHRPPALTALLAELSSPQHSFHWHLRAAETTERQRGKGRMKLKREKWDAEMLKEADVQANITQQPLHPSSHVLLSCPPPAFSFLLLIPRSSSYSPNHSLNLILALPCMPLLFKQISALVTRLFSSWLRGLIIMEE